MSVTKVLLDILIVLLAAKAAAEIAERVNVPAVVGEIVAGVIIGPSVLGIVGGDEVLRVLGELGVIILLLDVGLEMDIAELGSVGRASLSVATVGVIVPFIAGAGVGLAFGMEGKEAVFVGAALTATSVGITARVFGDLRALASVEARTVLGAAVADDVMGLVILTVVVRIVSEGSVSPLSIASVVLVAVLFLLVTSAAGVRLAPGLFAAVARVGRSSGTLLAVALAFTLAVSELASAAKLAPIVGAFVAGVSIGRSPAADRIRRELAPVGHLFVPVFFLQIGIDARVGEFLHPKVLGLAGALFAVAVVGKLASAAGLLGAPGDRLLVGIGMIPRGEVGLIFATLGLREHVFGQDIYAALLLVVLASTLLTPPALRWRLLQQRRRHAEPVSVTPRPAGGWLQPATVDAEEVDLVGQPPRDAALPIALEAAASTRDHTPGPRLLEWLATLPEGALPWSDTARARFFGLLETGGPKAWRLLAVTGVLERALPDAARALDRRLADPMELDPSLAMRWPVLTRVQSLGPRQLLARPERLLLAALVLDLVGDDEHPVAIARRVVQRLDLGAAAENAVAGLVDDAGLLVAASRRLDALEEERVLELAVHLGNSEQVLALHLLTIATADLEAWEQERLRALVERIQEVLARPDLTGRDARNLVERRRAEAQRLTTDQRVRERIAAAPRAYVLATSAPDIARHAALCEPSVGGPAVRADVRPAGEGEWSVAFAATDRVGLLAREAAALADAKLDVVAAVVATWGDGWAIGSIVVRGEDEPDAAALAANVAARLNRPPETHPVAGVTVTFDDLASPWTTVCRVEAPDRLGLLADLTAAFAAAGASVQRAVVHTLEGVAIDEFQLTDRTGAKLDEARRDAVRDVLSTGDVPRRRPWRSRVKKA